MLNLMPVQESTNDNQVQPFEFAKLDGNKVSIRTVMRDGEPWFVLADICKALHLTNAANYTRILEDDEKAIFDIALGVRADGTPYRRGSAPTCISESGLYKLVMRSDKPDAKPFQDWVTKTVLPNVRKTGSYVMGEEAIATATSLSELETIQEQMIALASRKADILEASLRAAQERIEVMQPAFDTHNTVMAATDRVRLLDVARTLDGIDLNKFTASLGKAGILYFDKRYGKEGQGVWRVT